jgi:hypothetical protein
MALEQKIDAGLSKVGVITGDGQALINIVSQGRKYIRQAILDGDGVVVARDSIVTVDKAGINGTGGIDLTPEQLKLQTTGNTMPMEFKFDPAEIRRLQNVPGFFPVILDIQAMPDLPEFLGLTAQLN